MVTIEIQGVPEQVRDTLAAQAKSRGKSLQAYLLELLTSQAGHGLMYSHQAVPTVERWVNPPDHGEPPGAVS
jgi:hypothetical protein